jgi:hypothetical protein
MRLRQVVQELQIGGTSPDISHYLCTIERLCAIVAGFFRDVLAGGVKKTRA